MISIFNRKELVTLYDIKRKAKICETLEANGIEYSIKVINRNSTSVFWDSRSRVGTLGQKTELSYEYIIYVKKSDFGRAQKNIGI